MVRPERFSNLPEYAFPRLRRLLAPYEPGGDPFVMTIGEPQHPFPAWVPDIVAEAAASWGKYPPNDGSEALLQAIAGWVGRRFHVEIDPMTQVLALNGTREGLFAAAVALCPEQKRDQQPVVLIPNPFYQVYAVAAVAAGAEPVFLNATADTGFLPDFDTVDADTLDRTAIAYICTPSNPQGAIASRAYLENLIRLAEKHDFLIFADECYSEIYRDDPPVGVLQVAHDLGADPERVVIFHSLSKRSNLPGLRSGFAASGPQNIRALKQLRAYAGAPLPTPVQNVSTRAWSDETHVIENRALYGAKFNLIDQIFGDMPGYQPPEGGFFLWLPVPDGEAATVELWSKYGLKVLPGAYLSRDTAAGNPGAGFIRVALVAPFDELQRGLTRLRAALDEMRTR